MQLYSSPRAADTSDRVRLYRRSSGLLTSTNSAGIDVPIWALGSYGITGGALGDSITEQNFTATGGALYAARGYLNAVRAYSQQAINIPPSLIFGVGGDYADQVLARTPAAIVAMQAAGARMCFVHAGTNNYNAAAPRGTFEGVTGDLLAIYALLKAAGIVVIAVPIIPRGTPNALDTTAKQRLAARLYRWFCDLPKLDSNIIVADPVPYLIDPASATGEPFAIFSPDGVHPNNYGADLMGYAVWRSLERYFPGYIPNLAVNAADLYDAANNPTGSLVANPLLNGSGGTLQAGFATGVSPDGCALTRDSATNIGTLAAVGSKIARIGGEAGSAMRIVVSGTPVDQRAASLQQTITTGYAAGDVVYMEARVRVLAGSTGLVGIAARCRINYDATSVSSTDMHILSGATPLVNGRERIWVLRSPPLAVPAGTQVSIQPQINPTFAAGVAASATIDVESMCPRKVA